MSGRPTRSIHNGDFGDWNAEHGVALRMSTRPFTSTTGAAARAVVVAAVSVVFVLFAASPATANGVTFPIASGVSGPYEYQVGVGSFSPIRKSLLIAVTLMVRGRAVIDADVTIAVSVDGSSNEVGPLDAANTLFHTATYELSLDLPELAREKVLFTIGVDSRHGPAVIEAEMIVPYVGGTFNGNWDPATAAPGHDQEETSAGGLVYLEPIRQLRQPEM